MEVRVLTPPDLLSVWEQGETAPPTRRALLLAAVHLDVDPDRLAHLSVGWRDRRLMALRGHLFGPRILGIDTCPECGEHVELAFDPAALGIAPPGLSAESPEAVTESFEPLAETLRVAGHEVVFRAPNSEDLAAIADVPDVTAARAVLLARCILSVRREGADVPLDETPAAVSDAVVARMAEIDPDADVELALTCPTCGQEWSAPFDIAAFLWCEIETWAARMLREVHVIASAYGWRESDILQLSPSRRRAYVELIAA